MKTRTRSLRTRFVLSILSLLLLSTTAIYDDQFGSTDWQLQNIGQINYGRFQNTNKISSIFCAISNHGTLLSCLDFKGKGETGQVEIIWRKQFTEGSKVLHFEYLSTAETNSVTPPDTLFVITQDRFISIKIDDGEITTESSKSEDNLDLTYFTYNGKYQAVASINNQEESLLFTHQQTNQPIIVKNFKNCRVNHGKLKVFEGFGFLEREEYVSEEYAYLSNGIFYLNGEVVQESVCSNSIVSKFNKKIITSCNNPASTSINVISSSKSTDPEDISEKISLSAQSKITFLPQYSPKNQQIFAYSQDKIFRIDLSQGITSVVSVGVAGKIVSAHVTDMNFYFLGWGIFENALFMGIWFLG